VIEPTPQQRRAIDRRDGSLLLSAGAGTGKTTVLVERFVAAVLEDGVRVEEMLAITFTEKAAAQLATRVRELLAARGAREAARDAEAAWISTIHGFCARVLRTHALAAGLDPEFRVLDAVEAERLGIDAFDRALAQFIGGGGDQSERLRLVATYTPDRLRDMVRTAYAHLRSRGEARPELPEVQAPRPAGERAALDAAIAPALAEIGAAEGKRVAEARERLERCSEALQRLGEEGIAEPDDLDGLALGGGNTKALAGEACQGYGAALDAYRASCVAHREYLDHVLLRDLIRLHGDRYATAKRERSGLDFDDLELIAADLLGRDEALRDHYAGRFKHVLVDELQDVNPLQDRILDLLERDNLFRVGDERQSIYRFRHADVGLFRAARAQADERGRAERLTVNFRSRGEILDAVDRVFGELWGEEFDALRAPSGEFAPSRGVNSPDPASEGPRVELLCVDRDRRRWDDRFADDDSEGGEPPFGAVFADVAPWRAVEARLLARRVDELTRDGGFAYGDVALLVRATTSIGVYERALEDRGIPTHVIGGRGYFSQQQVGDLRAWLAALANPLDELALHSVLASPLVGASLDALVLVAACGRRLGSGWDVWRVLEALAAARAVAAEPVEAAGSPGEAIDRLASDLPSAESDRLTAFVARFREERVAAARVSLETLIDRVVTRTGYDRAVLAMPAGERRMANVRKLMRMAREFEAEQGRDLRGFIDLVAERDLTAAREGEAPLEAEQLDAVRLMTVHRAKGLEFGVVCVADLGKAGREDDAALRITDDGRVGMRLASLRGGATDSSHLGAIRAEARTEDEEEERRVFYVAMTRAREHLVLSGATDLEKRPEPKPLEEPMRWLWRALAPELPDLGARAVARPDYEGRPVEVRCEVLRPADADELLPETDRRRSRSRPDSTRCRHRRSRQSRYRARCRSAG
jgi:ATP-dependent exoDNAse (exonuclease V) beta subunit